MEEALIKRIPPHSLEAEQSVIGAMLLDRDAILVASEILTSDDFYQNQYGIIFDAMVNFLDDRRFYHQFFFFSIQLRPFRQNSNYAMDPAPAQQWNDPPRKYDVADRYIFNKSFPRSQCLLSACQVILAVVNIKSR